MKNQQVNQLEIVWDLKEKKNHLFVEGRKNNNKK
jgi:hypothetical protein